MIQIELRQDTDPAWWLHVKENFDEFLIDHAACERKASATGVQFVVKYPDRKALIDPMISLAREELQHFHQVSKILESRGLAHRGDEKDPYVNDLLALMRNPPEERLLDRLLIFGIIERRGTERFGIVAKQIEDEELKRFYEKLVQAEARHHQLFVEAALAYFSPSEVEERLRFFEEKEAEIIRRLPIRAAVH